MSSDSDPAPGCSCMVTMVRGVTAGGTVDAHGRRRVSARGTVEATGRSSEETVGSKSKAMVDTSDLIAASDCASRHG